MTATIPFCSLFLHPPPPPAVHFKEVETMGAEGNMSNGRQSSFSLAPPGEHAKCLRKGWVVRASGVGMVSLDKGCSTERQPWH